MLWKCCTQYASKFGKISSGHRTGKGQFSFISQRNFYFGGISFLWGDFPGDSDGKASVYNAGDLGSIFELGRFPGEGDGNPLRYSCLENPMDGGAWCRLLSTGSQRVGHHWATSLSFHFHFFWNFVSSGISFCNEKKFHFFGDFISFEISFGI